MLKVKYDFNIQYYNKETNTKKSGKNRFFYQKSALPAVYQHINDTQVSTLVST